MTFVVILLFVFVIAIAIVQGNINGELCNEIAALKKRCDDNGIYS